MEESRQIVIGIDGATFDLLDDWVDQGKLPNFEKFYEKGVRATLNTTYPPLTAPAWTSFMTGCNPGKHGIYDFLTQDVDSEEVVNYDSIATPTVWEMMSAQNKRVGSVNVSVTYPPPEINGHVISGLLSSSDRKECASPSGLIEELEEKTGRTWWHEDQEDFSPSDLMKFYDAQMRSNETIFKYAMTLLKENNYDSFMVLFDVTDMISHFFWHFMSSSHPLHEERSKKHENAIFNAYKLVDDFIGQFDQQFGDERDIMLMSDHGFGPIEKMVNLNNFFRDEGLLSLKKTPLSLVKQGMRKVGVTPQNVLNLAEKMGLDFLAFLLHKSIRNKIIGVMGNYSDVDWSRSTCYSRGHMGQVHLAERHKQDESTYKEIRSRVAQKLRNDLIDPKKNTSVVTDILYREDLYHGPYLDRAPDLFLIMQNWEYIAYPFYSSGPELFFPHIQEHRYANHKINGVFLAKGPSFVEGKTIDDKNIVDIAPTMMYLGGIPVSEYMDGSVMESAICDKLLDDRKPETTSYDSSLDSGGSVDSSQESESVDRLKDLGYLGSD